MEKRIGQIKVATPDNTRLYDIHAIPEAYGVKFDPPHMYAVYAGYVTPDGTWTGLPLAGPSNAYNQPHIPFPDPMWDNATVTFFPGV